MKLYKKTRGTKTTEFVINDIKEACGYLVTQKNFALCRNSIFAITITNTDCKHERDLNHVITNRLFNRIKNDYKHSKEHTNYVFVIEYPEVISIGNYLPTNCKVHSHIVLNTSLTEEKIMEYIKLTFPKVKDADIPQYDPYYHQPNTPGAEEGDYIAQERVRPDQYITGQGIIRLLRAAGIGIKTPRELRGHS